VPNRVAPVRQFPELRLRLHTKPCFEQDRYGDNADNDLHEDD